LARKTEISQKNRNLQKDLSGTGDNRRSSKSQFMVRDSIPELTIENSDDSDSICTDSSMESNSDKDSNSFKTDSDSDDSAKKEGEGSGNDEKQQH
jgi:hypothetical protein